MKPAARRRLVLTMVVLGLPLVLAAGIAIWFVAGGPARRLAWTWNHQLDLPGDLAIGQAAIGGVDSATLQDLKLVDRAGHRVLDVQTLTAGRDDNERSLIIAMPSLVVTPEVMPFYAELIERLAKQAERQREPVRWAVQDGRIDLSDATAITGIVGSGRVGDELSGRIDATLFEQPIALSIAGSLEAAELRLVEPVDLPVAAVLALAATHGQTLPIDQALLPASLRCEGLRFIGSDPARLQGSLRWPDDHPWPIHSLAFDAGLERSDLVVTWRDGVEAMTLVLHRGQEDSGADAAAVEPADELRIAVHSGSLPLQPLCAILVPTELPLLRALLKLGVPPVMDFADSSMVLNEDGTELELHASWPGGSLEQQAQLSPEGTLEGSIALRDAARGSLVADISADQRSLSLRWTELRLPPQVLPLLPQPWRFVPWQALVDSWGATHASGHLSADGLQVELETGRGSSLRLDSGTDAGLQVTAQELDLAAALANWPAYRVEAGTLASLTLQQGADGWHGSAEVDAARIVCGPLSLAAEQATLQLQDRRLELDLATAGRASWRAEGFSARFPLTSPAFSLPWPRAPWQGRCRLAVAVDGRGVWNWRLEDGALPELIDGLQAAGRMQADGDRAEVEITAWSGRWLPPVLAAVLGERQPQRIEWTGATGSLELGDDRLVVDDDGWRGVFPRDTLALLAIPGFETVEADALGERCTLVLEHRAGTLSGVLLPTSVAIDGRTPAQLMTETGAQPWAPANPEDADAAPDASTTAEDPA